MSEELIRLENVSCMYGKISALKNLNLTINKGDYIGIIGPNGSGKSTLIKSILGLVKLSEGQIYYLDQVNCKKKLKMGYVPQISDVNRYFPISVLEVVLTGKMDSSIKPFFKYSKKDILDAHRMLSMVGLENQKDRQISELSGGEFQKMMIARSLIMNPDILLLDEPTAMVDVLSQRQILNLIRQLSKEITIILVTHQIQDVMKHVSKLVYLEKNVIAEGDPEEVYKYAYLKPVGKRRKA
ncbi:MAG: metal ABC transporter ATP-binding protein [Candidatus Izemoplasmatales bacterium]|nr:metal ABC transporter ATP-binding protein [Candidatus Izemoplasmatales bacterium]MDD4070290.1 metal ABC transporter ATP-binding protein [Candidatus Izemoplasmatales bacterium]